MKNKYLKRNIYIIVFIVALFSMIYLGSLLSLLNFEFSCNLMIVLIFFLFINEWLYNIFVKFNIILTIFIPTIILFLMGRPLILLIQGKEWTYYGDSVAIKYLLIMFFCVLGIILGKYIPKSIVTIKKTCKRVPNFRNIMQKTNIQSNRYFTIMISLFYGLTFSCYIFSKIVEFVNMNNKTYLEYYLGTNLNLPWIITFFSSLSLYVMCFYLAYINNKKKIIIILIVYIATTIPNLIIGQRNPFILAILFSSVLLYMKNVRYWKVIINKKMLTVIVLSFIFFLTISMSFVSSIRNDLDENKGLYQLVSSFVYDQGNTYETVCIGISHSETLRSYPNNNYTFSAIADYFKYGRIGNLIFNTNPLPGGNNATRVKLSNDLAHKISFLALEENYLKGAGIGTTYVLETFLDYGYFGVFFINCFYMFFCYYAISKFGKNIIFDNIIIYSLVKFFFIGRDSALIPFSGLFTIHYIFVLLVIYILYFFSKKLMGKVKLYEK